MKIQFAVFSSILTWVHFAHCQSEVEVLIKEVKLFKTDALKEMKDLQQKQNEGYEDLRQRQNEILNKLNGYEDLRRKQNYMLEKLTEMEKKFDRVENNLQGAVNNSQDSLQNIWEKLEKLEEIYQEVKDCLGREDLESFKNISSAGQQELESSLRQEISGVISLLETGGIDECSEGSHNCGDHEACTDKFVNFTCSCLPGFARNGSHCEDIDECTQGKAECSPQAACRNSVGSYSCSCNPSFEGDGRTCSCPSGFAQTGSNCVDIDECAQGKAECSPQAACRNSVGSYSCSCNPPFEGDGRTCSCPPGFAQNGSHCDDIDECARGKVECSPHAACRNSVGRYSCSCNPPFEGDGRTCCPPGFAQKGSHCDDMDECDQGKAECSPQAACRNSVGSYSCSCNPPFEGDGRTCSCPPGFAQNGSHCDDIDECARGKAECSPHAACRNSVGSYSCSCNPPFEGDGRTCCPPGFAQKGSHCVDMDECAQGKAECSPQAACRNSVGSYSCSCNPPFEGDGRTCSCPPGFAQNGSHCDDIDECARGKAECSPHAACRNSVGSYSCSCNPSFEGDGRTCCPPGFAQKGSHCDDMDECTQWKAECSPQAACRNSVGSYSCSCNPPFEGDGRTCSCPPGFAQNGSHCDGKTDCLTSFFLPMCYDTFTYILPSMCH
ncbi:latent-transforming growth factor beta-binding protein 4-like isoform X9 [Macrobrachium rosenbergii]|uniref:latent-transforming growth factor beta-binding protein 4-like isoform X9 n=1 Tax=Macrobrachium rosenbergii TaxID=79674 RepID=UPI0034D594CB